MLERDELPFHPVQRFDVAARRRAGEDPFLEPLDLLGEAIHDRKIAIDDGVHQRVEHVGRPVPQQIGLVLAPSPHVAESAQRIAAHRDHVVAADEHRDLSRPQTVLVELDRVHDNEE
jgi:hypothetical protein